MKAWWTIVGLALWPAAAWGYSAPGLYAGPAAADGGGGGRYFTGSKNDGYACSVCHVGGEPPRVTFDGVPIGAYEPGAVYTFDLRVDPGGLTRVALTGEVVDGDGAGMGRLAIAPKDLLTDEERCAGGGHGGALFEAENGRHIAALRDCTATRLRVQWTAPEAGRGPAFVHVAAVAADGEGTPEDDGVVRIAREVAELGAEGGGCRAAGGSLNWAMLVPLLGWRRWRRAAAVIVAAALTTGCARVKPYERGRLAQPDMALDGDEDLTAGQLHATEYREGSVGGEGGGGGGCGCN